MTVIVTMTTMTVMIVMTIVTMMTGTMIRMTMTTVIMKILVTTTRRAIVATIMTPMMIMIMKTMPVGDAAALPLAIAAVRHLHPLRRCWRHHGNPFSPPAYPRFVLSFPERVSFLHHNTFSWLGFLTHHFSYIFVFFSFLSWSTFYFSLL